MTNEEKQEVAGEVDNEGFDNTFRHKTSFPEIKDERFHELREKYIEAAENLEKYFMDGVEWD